MRRFVRDVGVAAADLGCDGSTDKHRCGIDPLNRFTLAAAVSVRSCRSIALPFRAPGTNADPTPRWTGPVGCVLSDAEHQIRPREGASEPSHNVLWPHRGRRGVAGAVGKIRSRSREAFRGTSYSPRFNMSGSLAMFDATRLASSIVICFASTASSSVERP